MKGREGQSRGGKRREGQRKKRIIRGEKRIEDKRWEGKRTKMKTGTDDKREGCRLEGNCMWIKKIIRRLRNSMKERKKQNILTYKHDERY